MEEPMNILSPTLPVPQDDATTLELRVREQVLNSNKIIVMDYHDEYLKQANQAGLTMRQRFNNEKAYKLYTSGLKGSEVNVRGRTVASKQDSYVDELFDSMEKRAKTGERDKCGPWLLVACETNDKGNFDKRSNVVGYLIYDRICKTNTEYDGDYELAFVCTGAQYRRKGYGSAIIATFVSICLANRLRGDTEQLLTTRPRAEKIHLQLQHYRNGVNDGAFRIYYAYGFLGNPDLEDGANKKGVFGNNVYAIKHGTTHDRPTLMTNHLSKLTLEDILSALRGDKRRVNMEEDYTQLQRERNNRTPLLITSPTNVIYQQAFRPGDNGAPPTSPQGAAQKLATREGAFFDMQTGQRISSKVPYQVAVGSDGRQRLLTSAEISEDAFRHVDTVYNDDYGGSDVEMNVSLEPVWGDGDGGSSRTTPVPAVENEHSGSEEQASMEIDAIVERFTPNMRALEGSFETEMQRIMFQGLVAMEQERQRQFRRQVLQRHQRQYHQRGPRRSPQRGNVPSPTTVQLQRAQPVPPVTPMRGVPINVAQQVRYYGTDQHASHTSTSTQQQQQRQHRGITMHYQQQRPNS